MSGGQYAFALNSRLDRFVRVLADLWREAEVAGGWIRTTTVALSYIWPLYNSSNFLQVQVRKEGLEAEKKMQQ